MLKEQFLYLAVDLLTLAGPLARAFEPRLRFYRRWGALAVAIAAVGAVFVAWDVAFTAWGVWGFNDRYLVGVTIANLPIEEWLFFVVVPYACVFSYEVLNHFWPTTALSRWARPASVVLAAVLLVVAALSPGRLYTVVTFTATAAVLLWVTLVSRPRFLGHFYRGYLACLVPFSLVNGVLTGTGLAEPVVWYSPAENLGIRLGTIPIEDSAYMLLLLLLNTLVYESLKESWGLPRVRGDEDAPAEAAPAA